MGFAKRIRASPTLASRDTDFGPRDHGLAHPQVAGILDPNAAVSHAEIVRSDRGALRRHRGRRGPGGLADRASARPARGCSTLLVDRARFPRDKPCGGGVTLRGAAPPALRDRARGRAADHDDRLPPPRSRRVRARRPRARRADDAAQAPRRLPGRAGRARGRRLPRRDARARGRARGGRAAGRHLRRRLARGRRGADRRRRRQRHVRARARARRRPHLRPGARGQRRLRRRRRRRRSSTWRCSSSATSRAATAGCSPRATTRTSAWAAGTRRARTCATTCAGSATATASPGRR